MSTGDMQMVARACRPGWTNLAIGEPVFLQAALNSFYPDVGESWSPTYPPCEGDNTLRCYLRMVTPQRPNPDLIVVTNGAKQALGAVFYALHKVRRVCTAGSPLPYWPSLPTLARMNRLAWADDATDLQHVKVLTYPNNPTGLEPGYLGANALTGGATRVWDAVYASEVYGWQASFDAPRHDIAVFSASKMYGLSGLRLGWAVFQSAEMAAAAAEYVELTTSGVSIVAQSYMHRFLTKVEADGEGLETCMHRAGRLLARNQRLFNAYVARHVEDLAGLPAGQGGMFAWFRPKDPERFARALLAARVTLVDGVHCGVPGYYRMSLGAHPDTVESALDSLGDALDEGEGPA